MVEIAITRNAAITVMALLIMLAIFWMISYSYNNTNNTLNIISTYQNKEGFESNKKSLDLANYGYTVDELKNKGKREMFSNTGSKSKLAKLKRGKPSKNTHHTKKHKTSKDKETYTNVLRWIDDDDNGKYDNFQDVLDEIDKIDVSAFGINSMGNTISRYSKNIDDRMNYAKKKNKHSRLDTSMAQLSVLTDEFKKLFAIDKLM